MLLDLVEALFKDKPTFTLELTQVENDSPAIYLLNAYSIPVNKKTLQWIINGGRIPKRYMDHRKIQRLIRKGKFPKTPVKNILKKSKTVYENCYIKSMTT